MQDGFCGQDCQVLHEVRCAGRNLLVGSNGGTGSIGRIVGINPATQVQESPGRELKVHTPRQADLPRVCRIKN